MIYRLLLRDVFYYSAPAEGILLGFDFMKNMIKMKFTKLRRKYFEYKLNIYYFAYSPELSSSTKKAGKTKLIPSVNIFIAFITPVANVLYINHILHFYSKTKRLLFLQDYS